jgi:hypothetical protein
MHKTTFVLIFSMIIFSIMSLMTISVASTTTIPIFANNTSSSNSTILPSGSVTSNTNGNLTVVSTKSTYSYPPLVIPVPAWERTILIIICAVVFLFLLLKFFKQMIIAIIIIVILVLIISILYGIYAKGIFTFQYFIQFINSIINFVLYGVTNYADVPMIGTGNVISIIGNNVYVNNVINPNGILT